jgi:hypothetical protein
VSARPQSRLPADEQQAELIERLRAARGAPVSFQELRAEGIETPAILSYELELVGMPVARPHRWKAPGRTAAAGLRIEESHAAQTLELSTPAPARSRFGGASHHAAVVAITALIVALAAGTTLALIDQPSAPRISVASGRGRADRTVVSHARSRSVRPRTSPVPRAGGTSGSASGASVASGIPDADAPVARNDAPPTVGHAAAVSSSAAQLQAEGHQLLGQARYAAAIADLRAALAASGTTVQEQLELARAADAGGATAPTPAAATTRDWPLPRKMRAFWPRVALRQRLECQRAGKSRCGAGFQRS